MKINLLISCIDNGVYAAILDRSLSLWFPSANSVTIVTSERDKQTNLVAEKHGCIVHNTDIWWAKGAHFNKGAAMEEARSQTMPWSDWCLFADADIVPPTDWHQTVVNHNPHAGRLYGARRSRENGSPINDGDIAGCFQLFHTSDPAAQERPLLTGWQHAGNYDSVFMMRWPGGMRQFLDLKLVHVGETGVNWFGVGKSNELKSIRDDRKRQGGWRHEQVKA